MTINFNGELTYQKKKTFFSPVFRGEQRICPSMQEPQDTQVWCLGWEVPLEKGMATHSSILAWRIPRTEEPGGIQSMGSQRVRYDWNDLAYLHIVRNTMPFKNDFQILQSLPEIIYCLSKVAVLFWPLQYFLEFTISSGKLIHSYQLILISQMFLGKNSSELCSISPLVAFMFYREKQRLSK